MNKQISFDDEKLNNNLIFIKDYLRQFCRNSRVAKGVSFDEGKDDDSPDYLLDCVMRCGYFYSTVKYTHNNYDNSLFITFAFDRSDYAFSTFDILNWIEVDDYSNYQFTGCEDTDDIKLALDKLCYFVDTYGYDITKAVQSHRLPELDRLYQADREVLYGPFWRDDEFYLEEDKYTIATGSFDTKKNKAKLISKLRGMDKITNFDKRKLAYLEGNNALEEFEEGTLNPNFKSFRIKVYVAIVFASIILCLVIYFSLKAIIFGDAFVVSDFDEQLIGLSETTESLLLMMGAMSLFLINTLGHFILIKFSPKNTRNAVKKKFNYFSKFGQILVPIGCAVAVVVTLLSPLSAVGFGDNKVIEFDLYNYKEYSYDEIKMYKVTGFKTGEGLIVKNDDGELYYYLGLDDHYSSYIPMVYEDEEDNKTLNDILSKHNVDIVELRTIEELDTIYEKAG